MIHTTDSSHVASALSRRLRTMFRRAGKAPEAAHHAKPPLPVLDDVDYEEGDAVNHGKLGDGVVESVIGEGEEAKLKIRFESETRTCSRSSSRENSARPLGSDAVIVRGG